MKRLGFALLAALCIASPVAPVTAATSDATLRAALQRDIDQYLAARGAPEHISAISLSISLKGRAENINLAAGRTQYHGGTSATPGNLWEIGSNTKAFTAVTILQLEAEGKLTLDETLGRWLPQYPAWKNVTIRRLLNMTSGIPGYDLAPAMLTAYARDPSRNFTIPQLIAYVYPVNNPHAPPPTKGYAYSNTNYLLAELIIRRVTGDSYASEIERRFFKKLDLSNTYYSATKYAPDIVNRMVAGYFFNRDPDNAQLAPILGRDVRADSVSWMQGAGGIVSTPEDLTRWARALYTGPILAPKQRAELLSLVSLKNGEPITATSAENPRGFGLGVAQMTQPEVGTVWFYEGETLGYRMVHVYFPKQDTVIAFGLNSQPDSKQNQSGKLAVTLYKTLQTAGKT